MSGPEETHFGHIMVGWAQVRVRMRDETSPATCRDFNLLLIGDGSSFGSPSGQSQHIRFLHANRVPSPGPFLDTAFRVELLTQPVHPHAARPTL